MKQINKMRLNKLSNIIDSSLTKNTYLLARYMNDLSVDLRGSMEYVTNYINYGFDFKQDSDLPKSAYTNVIKSCIDTVVSKLANQKVRPYFNSINGSYKTKQIIRQAQEYFDCIYDEQKVIEKTTEALRSAAIFGQGYIWINPFTFQIEHLPSWTVATSNTEKTYGKPLDMLVKYNNYPTTLLDNYKGEEQYCQFCYYVDLKAKKAYKMVNAKVIDEVPYNNDELPLITVTYTKPLYGNKTVSVVEELDGIQTIIDYINAKISAASLLTPGNVTYIREGSSLDATMLSNKTGAVYPVKLAPGDNSLPVVTVNPAPFDPMWQSLLDYYISKAYDMMGVSQLSAQSQKPNGLDSGIALQTMENIESDRFETQLNGYVNTFVEIAKMYINVIPEDAEIVAPSMWNGAFKWKELKEQSKLYKIQYSAATLLSKDPATKTQQVLSLYDRQIIQATDVGQYLDMPDTEDMFRGARALSDAIDKVIDLAIEAEVYDIPEYVGYQQLAQRITIVENELYASLSDDKDNNKEVLESISRIEKLEENLLSIMEENGFIEQAQTDDTMMETAVDVTSGMEPKQGEAPMVNAMNVTNEQDELVNPQEATTPLIENE